MPASNEERERYLKLIESQKDICDRFSNIQRIDVNGGDGAWSFVFVADDSTLRKNRKVVLKFFNHIRGGFGSYRFESFKREANILEKLRTQRNILPLVKELTQLEIPTISNDIQFPLVFLFYASHKAKFSLKNYIYELDNNALRTLRYFREICKAVQRIHINRICHRDLKPDNFLVFEYGYVCLSDFGSARDFLVSTSHLLEDYDQMQIGDPRYTALELLWKISEDEKCFFIADFFSLGAILFELFTRTKLTSVLFNQEIYETISAFKAQRKEDRGSVFNNIIADIIQKYPFPSIGALNDDLPKPLINELDKLYKGLACLNFRERITDFEFIFRKINTCEKLIKYYRSRS